MEEEPRNSDAAAPGEKCIIEFEVAGDHPAQARIEHVGAVSDVGPSAEPSIEEAAAPNAVAEEIEGAIVEAPSSDSESEAAAAEDEEEEEEEDEEFVGPIDPERCTASGAGFSGGAACAPVNLILTAKDAAGRRVREGGAYVAVTVTRRGLTEPISVEISDASNGSYQVKYTAPAKGSYELTIQVNGKHIGGSPFPVFFSAAATAEEVAAQAAEVAGGAGGEGGQQQAEAVAAMSNLAAASQVHFSLGAQAAQMGVVFPNEAATAAAAAEPSYLQRTVLVGGVSPFAQEALQAVFAMCGSLRSMQFVGTSKLFAFVEFGSEADAQSATRMAGVALQGQVLRVERAAAAKQAAEAAAAAGSGAAAGAPFLAMQAQQVHAYQLMHQQQAALAAQVAQLRAAQQNGGGGGQEAGTSGAMAAAAALARKLATTSDDRERSGRDRERERDRGHRRDRSRERSGRRDRDPKESSRRSGRDRSRERDYRDRRHRSRSRDRGKDHKDRKERRHLSRSRSRDRRERGSSRRDRVGSGERGRKERGKGEEGRAAKKREEMKDAVEEEKQPAVAAVAAAVPPKADDVAAAPVVVGMEVDEELDDLLREFDEAA